MIWRHLSKLPLPKYSTLNRSCFIAQRVNKNQAIRNILVFQHFLYKKPMLLEFMQFTLRDSGCKDMQKCVKGKNTEKMKTRYKLLMHWRKERQERWGNCHLCSKHDANPDHCIWLIQNKAARFCLLEYRSNTPASK